MRRICFDVHVSGWLRLLRCSLWFHLECLAFCSVALGTNPEFFFVILLGLRVLRKAHNFLSFVHSTACVRILDNIVQTAPSPAPSALIRLVLDCASFSPLLSPSQLVPISSRYTRWCRFIHHNWLRKLCLSPPLLRPCSTLNLPSRVIANSASPLYLHLFPR